MTRARVALASFGLAAFAIALGITSPLRQISADTVAGRMGGAVLRCAGSFDLSRIDWIDRELQHRRTFYYLHLDHAGELTSVFGPAPAAIAALALLDFGQGDHITDDALRRRERLAASMLVAISGVLLLLAAYARVSLRRATLTAALAVVSFAGAATLGQGLWQATTALPCLIGALATLAWRERRPRLAVATPALLALAVMLRPTLGPLALGVGLTWAVPTRALRTWLVATALALAAVSPLIVWNAIHLFSPLPLGQWHGNTQLTTSVFSAGHAGAGVAGLLVSPSRGLRWFAPLALVGLVRGLREPAWRYIAGGIVLQLVTMAMFYKWHGGQAFGPRLLAESTWIAIWLAFGTARPGAGAATPAARANAQHRVRAGAIAVSVVTTCIVGLLGLWRWHPEQWEARRWPEAHPGAFWDFADSPLTAMFRSSLPRARPAVDSPPAQQLRCDSGKLLTR